MEGWNSDFQPAVAYPPILRAACFRCKSQLDTRNNGGYGPPHHPGTEAHTRVHVGPGAAHWLPPMAGPRMDVCDSLQGWLLGSSGGSLGFRSPAEVPPSASRGVT